MFAYYIWFDIKKAKFSFLNFHMLEIVLISVDLKSNNTHEHLCFCFVLFLL